MTGVTSPTLVGRAAELAVLDDALRAATAGESRVVLLGGEAGVGKTRLVEEFTGRATTTGVRVLSGGCLELGTDGLPYAPVTAALRQLVGDIGPQAVRAAVPDAGVLARLLPELGEVTGSADSEIARARLFEHVLVLLQWLAAERSLVLVVEDAHWADASTRDLLTFLASSLRAEHVLLVVTFRSDELHRRHPMRHLLAELDRLPRVERLELGRLSRSETADLIRRIGTCETSSAVLRAVYDRSAGNPLFVESLLSCDGLPADLDDSLRDLLLRNVDQLGEATRRALRIASAGGVEVGHRLLAGVADMGDASLSDALRPAVEGNVLLADGDGYRFRHALIREAVHDELLPGEHTALHTAYAQAIEADPTLMPAGRAAIEVAHHRYAAHDMGAALAASAAAAKVAGHAAAYAEQLHMLDRVLSLWDSVADAAERAGTGHLTVLEDAIAAAARSGEPARGIRYATAALDEIDRGSEPVRAALVLQERSRMRGTLGEDGKASDLDEAEALVADQPPSPAKAQVLHTIAKTNSLWWVRTEQSEALLTEALAAAREAGDRHSEGRILTTLACHRGHNGRTAEQSSLYDEAMRIAESLRDADLLVLVLLSQSDEMERAGRHERAAALARQGIEAARCAGFSRARGSFLAINVADPLTALGRWDEALTAIQHALDMDPPPKYTAFLRRCRAEVTIARGEFEYARSDLAASGPLLRADPEPQARIPAVSGEAALALAEGRPGDAATIVAGVVDDPSARDPRYTWPLLAIGGRAAADLAAAGATDTAVLDRLRGLASTLPAYGPMDEARAMTFRAEVARATGAATAGTWQAVVGAWDALAQPYEAAYARYRAAETLVHDDKQAAAQLLVEAASATATLSARPLRETVDLLARRARIPLEAEQPASPGRAAGLTERELDVIRLLAAGRSNRQVAQELFISPKTASVHVSNILTKLEVATRGEAAAAAYRLGLIDDVRTAM
ncbi:MAG: helix-turn-helix transcriptional regulator [Streptosporangiales bacterium]